MAQYELSFGAGELGAYPAALNRRWVTTGNAPTVVALGSPVLGMTHAASVTNTSAARRMDSVTAIEADADRATVKFRALVNATNPATTPGTSMFTAVLRASGAAASENGYTFALTRSGASQYRLGINRYSGGTHTESYNTTDTSWVAGDWFVVEGDISGTDPVVLNFSIYAIADLDTPIATHTRSDTDAGRLTAAGWVGFGRFAGEAVTQTAYIAYATGADSLPVAPWDTADPVAFTGTVPAQSFVEDSAITPLDLSTYFSGDFTPFSYAVTTGTLPTGLSLNASTGVISGTPTTPAAAVSLVVTATDDESNTAATNAFNVTITAAVAVVKGVEVILHDRATLTPRASVTGITARWWDSPTAAGAPLLKTDSASTNGSGLLTLDIDSVTSLSVAALGYLVLYKAGAGADTDMHFAGRVAVSDIA